MRGSTGSRGQAADGPTGAAGVRTVLGLAALALLASGCAAVDDALADDGDLALVDDASARAEADAPPPPAPYLTRPVDFLIGDRTDEGGRGTLVSPGGMCGFQEDLSWRAGVADGAVSMSPDSQDVTWDAVEITGEAPELGEATAEGLQASVQLRPIRAVARVHEFGAGPEVELEGVLELDPTGLAATFTAVAAPVGTDGASAVPEDLVIEVACGARTDDAG